MLAACGPTLPSAANPTCSWNSTPPANAESLCRVSFSTVSAVTSAVAAHDAHRLRALVHNRAVVNRLLFYSTWIREHGAQGLHVVPTLTLDSSFGDRLGVYFFLRGLVHGGKLQDDAVLFLRVSGSHAIVVGDQPGVQSQSPMQDHPDPPW